MSAADAAWPAGLFPSIPALHAAYAAGLAPAELIAACYRRLAAVGDPGIFITLVDENEALAAASRLGAFDPSRPLWGVPFAVKDNIDVAGLPTTAACAAFAHRPDRTAPAVQRLLEAGAILLGKTNLDQFATGLVGLRTPYPPPRNAIDPAYVPGGSSSGSAVAVAHGIVAFALGTDTAGSGRVPAGLNNVVGLKPTLGMVSSRGMVPACRTLDTISVFAGTVADARAVLRLIAGYDAADPWSRHASPPPATAGTRIGVPDRASRRFAGDALSERAFDAVLVDLARLGAEVIEVDLSPCFDVAALLYAGPWIAERYQAIRGLIEGDPAALHPVTRRIIEAARAHSAADAFAGLYRLAELRRETEAIWQRIDALAVPTYPRPHRITSLDADPIGPNSELGTYTNFVNLLDLCALAVPGRRREDGLPAGVTLIAPAWCDAALAALGERLHAAAGQPIGAGTTPVPAPPARGDGEVEVVEIAVVGAHMRGMALNHELLARGGRFLRAVATTPEYRLYALAGGPPARPALLRVGPGARTGTGAAIETEIWALPVAGFGDFVARIPAPLGIATLRLADGTTPKGFAVEPAGLAGATDITRYGGWRAYLAAVAPHSETTKV